MFSSSIENSASLSSIRRLLPDKLELFICTIFTILLMFIGSLGAIGTILGISGDDKKSFTTLFTHSFSSFINRLDDFSFSPIIVTYVIYFFITLFCINILIHAYELSRELQQDVTTSRYQFINTRPFSKKEFWKGIFSHIIEQLFKATFLVIWAVFSIFYVLPLGLKAGGIYLSDLSAYSNLIFGVLGFLIIGFGVVIWLIYFKLLFLNK